MEFFRFIAVFSLLACGAQSTTAGFLNPQFHRLDNGLTVGVVEDHRSPMVDIMVAYKVGAADDKVSKSGISHFLEHMMFKGVPGFREQQFVETIEDLGGQFHAHTTLDYTLYGDTLPKDHVPQGLDMEARRMAGLVITDDQVDRERKVILEELSLRRDGNHHGEAFQVLMSLLYVNHPYRRSVGGYDHEVQAITRQDIVDFHQQWYGPNNALLLFAGDMRLDEAVALAKKYFGGIQPRGEKKVRHRLQDPPRPKSFETRGSFRDGRVQQPTLVKVRSTPVYDGENPIPSRALGLLADLLGGSMTSHLWLELVEKQQLARHVSVDLDKLRDHALLEISLSPMPSQSVEAAEKALLSEIQSFIKKGVSQKQVDQEIQKILQNRLYAKDNISGVAQALAALWASDINLGYIEDLERELGQVKASHVMAAAQEFFSTPFPVTVLILPEAKGGGQQ